MEHIAKGSEFNLLTTDKALRNLRVVFTWDIKPVDNEFGETNLTDVPFDIDASCFMLNNFKKIRSERDFVFYNNAESEEGEVKHSGGDTQETFDIALDKIPFDASYLIFALSIHNATEKQQDLSLMKSLTMRIINADNDVSLAEIIVEGEDLNKTSAIIMGDISRVGADWICKAECQAVEGGLAQIARDFDVDVRES